MQFKQLSVHVFKKLRQQWEDKYGIDWFIGKSWGRVRVWLIWQSRLKLKKYSVYQNHMTLLEHKNLSILLTKSAVHISIHTIPTQGKLDDSVWQKHDVHMMEQGRDRYLSWTIFCMIAPVDGSQRAFTWRKKIQRYLQNYNKYIEDTRQIKINNDTKIPRELFGILHSNGNNFHGLLTHPCTFNVYCL